MGLKKKKSFFIRHTSLGLLAFIFLITLSIFIGWIYATEAQTKANQVTLQPFYNPKALTPTNKPGDILKIQPMTSIVLPEGKAYRILYVSEFADGKKVVSSGIVFIPQSPPPKTGRKTVAWAHGTIGMGNSCAPSRSQNPLSNMSWVSGMLKKGWIVAATDYYGLGTPGTERYLLGADQARDVLNSVRAASQVPSAHANGQFALWGHSQGGQAVLFAAHIAPDYAPDIKLIAVAAAAPATELKALLNEQYDKIVAWVIGPEMVLAWQTAYPHIPITFGLSKEAKNAYPSIAESCILSGTIQGYIRTVLQEKFFTINPVTLPTWNTLLTQNTPSPLLPSVPLLIAQSTSDTVVLPSTTALFIQKSCIAESSLQVLWLKNVTHQATAQVSGPDVTTWLAKRFAGEKIQSECNQKLPIHPAIDP